MKKTILAVTALAVASALMFCNNSVRKDADAHADAPRGQFNETCRQLPGEWVFEYQDSDAEYTEVNAVLRKVITFDKGGKFLFVESKVGQSGPYVKEDWEFRTYGVYSCKDDTVTLAANRIAAVRRMFQRLREKADGGQAWEDDPGPIYDSTVTDGSEDRIIMYDDLKEGFKKVK